MSMHCISCYEMSEFKGQQLNINDSLFYSSSMSLPTARRISKAKLK